MRGTLAIIFNDNGDMGIIPAYAGNTSMLSSRADTSGDHPRVCGEHIKYAVEGATSQGSSPRMRGTPLLRVLARVGAGIIPAYAGNTLGFDSQC